MCCFLLAPFDHVVQDTRSEENQLDFHQEFRGDLRFCSVGKNDSEEQKIPLGEPLLIEECYL